MTQIDTIKWSHLFVQATLQSSVQLVKLDHLSSDRLSPNEKKALRETQTLHAGCSKAEPKISPRRSPP